MESTTQSSELDFVKELLQQHTGIAIRDDQDYLIVSRLSPLLLKANLASIGELVHQLQHNPTAKLQRQFIEAMTNHETSFFRDIPQFESLKSDILPELIRRNIDTKSLNIWSAACATGQEPYSLAMLIHDHFPQLATWDLHILASDISDEALQVAREAQYNQLEISRGLPAQLLVRHFAEQDAVWQVDHTIRSYVDFEQINLIDSPLNVPKMDVVLLRNALIYFDTEVKRQVLLKVYDLLRDGGYLLLGIGESTSGLVSEFDCIAKNNTIYFQKPLTKENQ